MGSLKTNEWEYRPRWGGPRRKEGKVIRRHEEQTEEVVSWSMLPSLFTSLLAIARSMQKVLEDSQKFDDRLVLLFDGTVGDSWKFEHRLKNALGELCWKRAHSNNHVLHLTHIPHTASYILSIKDTSPISPPFNVITVELVIRSNECSIARTGPTDYMIGTIVPVEDSYKIVNNPGIAIFRYRPDTEFR